MNCSNYRYALQRAQKKRPTHYEYVAWFRLVVLPASAGAARCLPLLLEALRAVDWLVTTRHERHLGFAATRCACCAVHFALAIARAAVATTIAVASVMCTLPKLLLTLFNNLLRLIWPESALGRERFAFD